nr:hypothetical protein Iba_chr01bCG18950 [Ipomoea batatas]
MVSLPVPVLLKHECNVSVRHDIMGGFQNASLRGFYFQFVVSQRVMLYYFSNATYDWVHQHDVVGEQVACGRFVVKVEDMSQCEVRAVHVITGMLRTINIAQTEQPEMVWKIYSTVRSLCGQVEDISDVRIPILVDIVAMVSLPVPVLLKHECNVSVRHDIMGGFQNASLRGFYFQFVVSQRRMLYYFSNATYDWVHQHDVVGEQVACGRFVVKVEDMSQCEVRAVHVITGMLRTINIAQTEQPEMVWKIYSTVRSLCRQAEDVSDVRIPVLVDIVRVFQQAVVNPFVVPGCQVSRGGAREGEVETKGDVLDMLWRIDKGDTHAVQPCVP